MAAYGPGTTYYGQPAPGTSGWGGSCMVALNIDAPRKHRAAIDTLRGNGVETLAYLLAIHDYPGPNTGMPEWRSLYNGKTGTTYNRGDTPLSWFWRPASPSTAYVGAYSGYLMDMRAGSAWTTHVIDWCASQMADPSWRMDGWFLDVLGDDYLGAISGLSTPEQVEYRAGVVDFARRLRARLGDDVLLVANNTWQTQTPINGLVLENHTTPGPYYYAQLARADAPTRSNSRKARRNTTLNGSNALVETWAAVDGVDIAMRHNNDGYMSWPTPPFGILAVATWPVDAGHIAQWDSTTGGGEPGPDPDPVAPSAVIALTISEPIPGQIRITFQMPVGVTGYRSRFKYGLGQTFTDPEDGFEFRSASAQGGENVETAALGFTADTPVTVGVWARNGDLLSPVTTRDITTGPITHSGVRVALPRSVAPARRIVRI